MFLLVCMFSMQVAMADNDKPITFEQLPAAAQTFIKQHFADAKVAFVKMEKNFLIRPTMLYSSMVIRLNSIKKVIGKM